MSIEKTIKVFECPYCSLQFSKIEQCEEHESKWCLDNEKIKWKEYFIEKFFKGGSRKYKFRTTIPKKKWEDIGLWEYIGGGHNSGCTIYEVKKSKSKDFKELRLPIYFLYEY